MSRRALSRPIAFAGAILALGCAAAATILMSAPAVRAGPAPNVHKATPATLATVIRAAQPGDVVQLQAGVYGDLELWNLPKAAPGVVVEPAPGAVPDITSINASKSDWLKFVGLEVKASPSTTYAVAVGGGANISFDRMLVHQRDNAALAGIGVFIRGASNITVTNSTFHHLWGAIQALESSAVTVTGNKISLIESDGIVLAGTGDSTVSKNDIRSILFANPDSHPDAIQLYAVAGRPRPANNRILDNLYVRGDGKAAQGVFVEDNDNLTIAGNALVGPLYNGIGLARTNATRIEDNLVQGYSDIGTRIIIRGGSADVLVRNNVAQEIVNYRDGAVDNPRYKAEGNQSIRGARIGDITAMTAWLARKSPG